MGAHAVVMLLQSAMASPDTGARRGTYSTRVLETGPRSRRDWRVSKRRVEQAVDAIAVEVERVAEGQRFTTSLLAERAPGIARMPEHVARE